MSPGPGRLHGPGGRIKRRRPGSPAPGKPLGCPCLTEKSGGELAVMKHRRTDLLWLLGVSAAFTSSVIAFTPLHQGFSWDEVVYVSQISQHTPSMPWAAERARGMPLLVAPVTLLTASPAASPVPGVAGWPGALSRLAGMARAPARMGARAGSCGLRGFVGGASRSAVGLPQLLGRDRRGIRCGAFPPGREESGIAALRLYPADGRDRLQRPDAPSRCSVPFRPAHHCGRGGERMALTGALVGNDIRSPAGTRRVAR